MATTLYFRDNVWGAGNETGKFSLADDLANLAGVATAWSHLRLTTGRGAAASTRTRSSVTGPTAGIELTSAAGWVSAPLDQDVTIAGSITMNLRMAETLATANAGAQIVMERIGKLGTVLSTILNSEKGTELGTTEAAQNWSATPTSTAMKKGDRIRVRVAANDAGGTMATGSTITFWVAGPTSAASGDSFLTFTETFGFQTTLPTNFTVYPRDTASDIDPGGAGTDTKEVWTTRGASNANAVVNTAAGWTTPIQWTKTAGGNLVEWYTPPLDAFTLSGLVAIEMKALESNILASATMRAEVAVCNSDGSVDTTWGSNANNTDLTASNAVSIFCVAGPDTAVSVGQRLRIRFSIDDANSSPMVTGHTATLNYNGAVAATGDSFLIFDSTLTLAPSDIIVAIPQVVEQNDVIPLAGVTRTYVVPQVVETDIAQPLEATTIPQNFSATPLSASEVVLGWDPLLGATSYDIERDGVIIAQYVVGNSYNDTGLAPNTAYSYRVRAVRPAG